MGLFLVALLFTNINGILSDDASPLCQSKSDTGGSALKTIEQWWYEEMSIKKPFKCNLPQGFKISEKASERSNILTNRVPIKSYPCDLLKDETSIKFHFRGKIIDGQLTGPGRLSLTGSGLTDSSIACLKVNNIGVVIFQKFQILSTI